MWFATLSGLNRWDGYEFEAYAHVHDDPTTLSDATIRALHVDAAGRLRVGTNQGIDRRNSGLPDATVYGMLADRRGRLWLSTHRGLVCYDPAQETFRTFGIRRDLQSSEFNGRAYFQALDGEMFFGGVSGMNAFFPDRITDNPHLPRVMVTAASVTPRGAQRPESASTPVIAFACATCVGGGMSSNGG